MRGAWRTVLAIAVLLCLPLWFDATRTSRLAKALFNAGHAPLFGIVALIVRSRFDALGARVAGAAAFAVAFVLGVGVEALQGMQPGREMSVIDLVRNGLGAAAFLLLWPGRRGTSLSMGANRRVGRIVVAALLLVAACAEVVIVVAGNLARARALPVVASFDGSWWEADVVRPQGATLRVAGERTRPAEPDEAGGFARLDLQPGDYPGIALEEPSPDWRGYRRLVLPVYVPGQASLPVTIRVHDALHDNRLEDRFNRTTSVPPGHHLLSVSLDEVAAAPRGRRLDLSHVRGVIVFVAQVSRPTTIFLGPMRLE